MENLGMVCYSREELRHKVLMAGSVQVLHLANTA